MYNITFILFFMGILGLHLCILLYHILLFWGDAPHDVYHISCAHQYYLCILFCVFYFMHVIIYYYVGETPHIIFISMLPMLCTFYNRVH